MEIIASFTDSVICIVFVSLFLNIEKEKRILILPGIAVYFGLTLIGDFFLPPGFSLVFTILLFLASIVFALLICQKQYIKAIIACSIYKIVIILVGSTLFSILSFFISNIDELMQGYDGTIRIVSIIINKIIIISLLSIIVVVFKKGNITDKATGFVLFFISILTILGMGFTLKLLAANPEENRVLSLLIVIVLALVDMAAYLLVNQVRKLEKQKYELKSLNDRYELQQDKYSEAIGVWNNVRKVQHDVKQHLLIIDGMLRDNDTEGCRKYVGELIPDTNQMGKIICSDNVVLDYLINAKLCALDNTEVIVSGVIGDLSDIPDRDLVSIFGNIIDNAIEAIDGLEEKRIELLFSRQDANRIIICKNTLGGPVLNEKGELRTTKNDPASHGLGHVIVEETVSRLGGMIDYSESGNMFTVQIILPEQDGK